MEQIVRRVAGEKAWEMRRLRPQELSSEAETMVQGIADEIRWTRWIVSAL
ncbi:hypothetical protein RLPCCGM1_p0609 [Rhizobium leguminosarum bv. phaseoli CCGM1]|nr:hypothetical protein [Rhizobium phaseoli]KEC70835.1 hypothetical protein RLPCCGM1_p0609 [Rhizobium leguminosarum bv. phaseoli CCGM1]